MGCGSPKKDVENQMMIMQLERVNIQMERAKNIKLLEDMDGVKRRVNPIPDYIDPKFAEEKKDLNNKESTPLIKGGVEINKTKKKKKRRKRGGKKGKKNKKTTSNEIDE